MQAIVAPTFVILNTGTACFPYDGVNVYDMFQYKLRVHGVWIWMVFPKFPTYTMLLLAWLCVYVAWNAVVAEVEKVREELKEEIEHVESLEIKHAESLRRTRVEALDNKCNEYAFKTSVWDLALVIGMEDHEIMGSIFVTMLLVLNALMQIFLCLVINDSLTLPLIGQTSL